MNALGKKCVLRSLKETYNALAALGEHNRLIAMQAVENEIDKISDRKEVCGRTEQVKEVLKDEIEHEEKRKRCLDLD